MADRAEKSRRDRREPHPLAVLAGVLAAFLLLAACYVGYQALHILFPQNVYETALPYLGIIGTGPFITLCQCYLLLPFYGTRQQGEA